QRNAPACWVVDFGLPAPRDKARGYLRFYLCRGNVKVKRPKVLLADDHLMVAEGLRTLLQGSFDLVGIAANGYELMRMANERKPDVIVADFAMPGLNGIDAVRILKQQGLQAKCILLTMHADRTLAMQAFKVGAVGYILKHSAGRELLKAIHGALRG